MLGNPEWTYNLLHRSDTMIDFLKRQAWESQSSISKAFSRKALRTPSNASIETLPDERYLEIPSQIQLYRSVGECILVNFIEGASIGGVFSVLVCCLPPLLKGKVRKALKLVLTSYNMRVAFFMGSLMAIPNTLLHIRRSRGHLRGVAFEKKSRFFIALLSGISVSTLPDGVRRFVVFLLLTRSIEILARMYKTSSCDDSLAYISERNSATGDQVFSPHETVGLTVASMSVITTTWFGWPHLVNKGYLHFLDNISNIQKEQFRDVGKILTDNVDGRPDLKAIIDNDQRPCVAFHPDSESCRRFAPRVFAMALVTRTIPFYFKIYQIPLLFSFIKKRGRIDPALVRNFIVRLWWSGLFLAVLDALVGGTVCALSHQKVIPKWYIMPICGAVSGLSLYLEQAPRRLELALYMFGQALQMIVNAYIAKGYWRHRNFDILVSGTSAALMLFANWEKREDGNPLLLRESYSFLFSKIFDTRDKRHGYALLS